MAEACTGASATCPADTGLPDGDGDGTCDAQDDCPLVADPGQADSDGNGAITAGELSEYMRSTFYRIALQDGLQATVYGRDAQPVGSGYQHILVDRGGDGMAYEQVLLRVGAPRVAAR